MQTVISVIKAPNNQVYLDMLCRDLGKDPKKLSDFELFAAVCEGLPFMYGSRLYDELFCAMGIADADIGSLASRDAQKALWMRLNGDDTQEFDISKKGVSKGNIRVSYHANNVDTLFVGRLLDKQADLPKDLDAFISTVSESDLNIGIDMEEFQYFRPDEFHAALAYKKAVLGEKRTAEESSCLISWIVCRALMIRDLGLYIDTKGRYEQVLKLLELLDFRRLYPQTVLAVSKLSEAECAINVIRNSAQKNISSEIVVSEEIDENIASEILKCLLYEIPSTRISIRTGSIKKYDEILRLTVKSWE